MDSAISILEQADTQLEGCSPPGETIERKAERIVVINELDSAFSLLKLCDESGILPGSRIQTLHESANRRVGNLTDFVDQHVEPPNLRFHLIEQHVRVL